MNKQENIEWLNKALYGYTEAMFRDRFRGIILTESAMMKMGVCFGFISAHEELIENFFDKLEFLNQHEMIEVEPNQNCGYRHKAPNKITKLNDDGSLFGFGFIFMNLMVVEEDTYHWEQLGLWKDKYKFGINGGLIFHGYGNQNFCVTLDNNQPSWSIHT